MLKISRTRDEVLKSITVIGRLIFVENGNWGSLRPNSLVLKKILGCILSGRYRIFGLLPIIIFRSVCSGQGNYCSFQSDQLSRIWPVWCVQFPNFVLSGHVPYSNFAGFSRKKNRSSANNTNVFCVDSSSKQRPISDN